MIRPANKEDAEIITTVSFASKAYWGYPEEYFDIWKNELTQEYFSLFQVQ